MRKVVLQMMTTLNGRLDDPDAWITGIEDDLYTAIDHLYEKYDTVLVGSVTYEEMAAYWPGAETDPKGSEASRSMARKMNSYKKFVISKGMIKKPLKWNNSELMPAQSDWEIISFVSELKARPGADIHLSGGAKLAQTFIRLGLVDEYRFFVYPVVSAGRAWFDRIGEKSEMELLSAKAYKNGVVGLYYKPQKSG